MSELYNKGLKIIVMNISKNKLNQKFNRINLKHKDHDYDEWFTEE